MIFLDEPTTGLDAFNAQNVMTTLIKLAKAGRTIACTIHQPRSEIYSMLDDLMLLSEGYEIYFGCANEAQNYFSDLGYVCPPSFNPSDYFLDVISLDARSKLREKASKKRIQFLAESYNDYQQQHPLPSDNNNLFIYNEIADRTHQQAESEKKQATTWFTQFRLLLQRSVKILVRERGNVAP